jgi:inhibitor of cysteine peptidase
MPKIRIVLCFFAVICWMITAMKNIFCLGFAGQAMKLVWRVILLASFLMPNLEGRQMVQVSERENGNTVTLTVGDALEILLESNPSTGYQWVVDKLGSAVLKQGEPGVAGAGGAIGASSKEVLRFEAVASGQTVVNLNYRRPFGKAATPTKSYRLNIFVRH